MIAVLGLATFGHVQTFRVPSQAMYPTLSLGEKVRADFGAYDHATPRRGDIVILHPPQVIDGRDDIEHYCGEPQRQPGQMCAKSRTRLAHARYIERVVGLPGDRLSLRGGRLTRNGERVKETFIQACPGQENCDFPRTITVPAGRYLLLGDNRGGADDSRYSGALPRKALIARVVR